MFPMPDIDRVFRCLLLGEEPLLFRCGDVLRQRGHAVVGVVTASATLRRWCDQHGIRVLGRSDYPHLLKTEPVDILCSVTHPALIAAQDIGKARYAALNYHDGPLPGYGGINASAWALVNGEKRHAIVWHHLTSGLDAGDIVERREVIIDERETSLSLNMKNAALALEGFRSLVERLERGDFAGTPQDASIARQVFSRHDRPAAMATIDWAESAETLDRLIRACEFGPYANRFGLMKVVHQDRAVVVREAIPIVATGEPGEILAVTDEHLDVACGANALRLKRLLALNGDALSGTQAVTTLGGRVGSRLQDPARIQRATHSRAIAEGEPFFVKALSHRLPVVLPFALSSGGAAARVAIDLPESFRQRFGGQVGDALVAAYAVVLSVLCREASFDLALVDVASRARLSAADGLLFPSTPLRVTVGATLAFAALVEAVRDERARLETRGAFLQDLVLRHPSLAEQVPLGRGELSSAAVVLGSAQPPPGAALTLALCDGMAALISDGRVNEERLQTFAGQLLCVLSTLAETPDVRVESLDLLTPAQLQQQVFGWNATSRAFPQDMLVHGAFEQQVDVRPRATALVCDGRSMTFLEVERGANRIANALRARGVGPGTYVGICMGRGFDLVGAMLGVVKAGAAYVPVDADLPLDRARFMLDDAGCTLLLTDAVGAGRFSDRAVLQVDGPEIGAAATDRPRRSASARDVCYAIYTSGSTGQPKGVVLTHRAVVNTLDWVNRTFEVTHDDRLLFVTSPSFDLSVYDVFGVLGAGASVDIASESLLADPAKLAAKLCQGGITLWDSAPAALVRLTGFLPESAQSRRWRRAPTAVRLARR